MDSMGKDDDSGNFSVAHFKIKVYLKKGEKEVWRGGREGGGRQIDIVQHTLNRHFIEPSLKVSWETGSSMSICSISSKSFFKIQYLF